MPGEPGPAPLPGVVEAWPSVAPFGEASRISVSNIVLAFLCSSAGSTFASPGGQNHTWPPTAQTTGLDQVSDPGIAAQSGQRLRALISWGRPAGEVLCCQPACRGAPRTRSSWRSCRDSGSDRIRVLRAVQVV